MSLKHLRFISKPAVLLATALSAPGFEAFITMKDGYFYDPAAGRPWVPHGIAYQTWNRPLGVWQTHDQIDYDLDEMVKMGANSIRIDMVWQHIEEDGDNQWKWENYDYLIQAAEQRGIRIFALVGYQWPPNWFPDEWYTMHPPEYDSGGIYHAERWPSDIINYEHPEARRQYAEFFSAVCSRYKDSKAIVAWIVGNEYGYLGLWSGLLDGYDPWCEQAFRDWAQAKYGTISNVNATWGTDYAAFSNIVFVEKYTEYGAPGAQWADMVQWREESIADYTAAGAWAARQADTNHLLSYSTVGMQWGEEDWRYHAEHRGKITRACEKTNAPLSFFSVNNYPWSILGHESQNGHWGISYTKKVTVSTNHPHGMPVLYSETGFTSSETMWPGMNEFRQGPLVRNSLWESLVAGAIGTHIFAWHDRPYITDREKGFGILYADRNIKPAYWVSRDAFTLMDQADIGALLAGSSDPKPDIAFLWTPANHSQYNRYECEMQQLAGALERLGYEPWFMDLEDLAAGAHTNYRAIVLPRNMRVDRTLPGHTNSVLNYLLTRVIADGVHVLASADLPGMQDENGNPRAAFSNEVQALFGINAGDSRYWEVAPRAGNFVASNTVRITVTFTNGLGKLAGGYVTTPRVWKYSDEVKVAGGTLWGRMDVGRNKGFEQGSSTNLPGWYKWGDVWLRAWFPLDGTNHLQMWGDSGIWQDFDVAPYGTYKVSAYLRNNNDDPLHDGKEGLVALEWYDVYGNKIGVVESPHLTNSTPGNSWVLYTAQGVAPTNAVKGRRLVRIQGPGGGSLYVDDYQQSPALVVKDHGTAKAAIFLYSVGDILPDGDGDGEMDVLPWQWRYDIFDAVVRQYFGVQPALEILGTNAHLCLAEYRTCADSSTLWQVKNYWYDPEDPASWTNAGGGSPQTFTIRSALFSNKTVRAFEQGRILETNCDGEIQLTLDPDGQEILHVYPPKTNQLVCQLGDAYSVVHPMGGDYKNSIVKVKFDTLGMAGLNLVVAFMEVGDNGDGVTNEIYQKVVVPVTGHGVTNIYMYIPDANQSDTDYISTPDGGQYQFAVWLEDSSSNRVTDVASLLTQLEWGVRPTSDLPASIAKGSSTNFMFEWEELYEQLYWQHCPMERNDAFPTRVAVFRSLKTEAQYPGHLDRVNAVCDWLETLGYESANKLDISFDNVIVRRLDGAGGGPVVAFSDDLESGTNGWTAQGLWHQSTARSASPTHSWVYNDGTDYDTGIANSGALITPWISLSNSVIASVTFKSWYETEDTGTAWDKKTVLVTTDGTNWTQIKQVSGPNKQWTTQTCDLSAYAGRQIKLKFLFDTVDAIYNHFEGWYVDDIEVVKYQCAETVLFSDDMESGTNGWTAQGLWHQSAARSVSPTRSWVYNDGTDFDTGLRNSGALITPWIDLAGVASATLTFQSWYETEDTGTTWDRKIVQVTTDGTNWTQVLQVSSANRQWVSWSCDLTPYCGGQVKVRFFFDTVDALYNAYEGWYVDDVKVKTVAGLGGNVFADEVESGTNGWAAEGLWHIAADLSASPTHSWAYNDGVDYDTGVANSGSLVSPWIDLTPAEGATLTFKSWYETEDVGTTWDRKRVYVTTDGTNWTQILQVSGPNRQWTTQTCDLNAFAGHRIRLKFHFDTVDALYNAYKGWYVDDITVAIVGGDILFFDSFAGSPLSTNWIRVAGAANWDVGSDALRAWRIGNDDNILAAGDPTWSNYTVQADIRYNTQDPYFSDAELYVRFIDRDNFVKVLIQNFYGFWRLKYVVRVATNNVLQYWVHSFSKTNHPVENTWYSLAVDVEGTNYTVYFDGEQVGSFSVPATNFAHATSRIGIGSSADQLGVWEPQKGYYFIDDDEYSYYGSGNVGRPLNLDWGYLRTFFGTLVLPSVYVMNDREASNVVTWVNGGYYNVIALDGGVAMKNETGASDPGRVESLFGVAPSLNIVSGLSNLTFGAADHYVRLDYAENATLPLTGNAVAWTTATNADVLATVDNGSASVPAVLCNRFGADEWARGKAFCFNFAAETGGQLTNALSQLARRAFEWARGQASKVRMELKYVHPNGTEYDVTLASATAWVLGGSGLTNIAFTVPGDGIMTGTNAYWAMYVYPWDSLYPWGDNAGFYTSANDNKPVEIPGLGLQILGACRPAWGGRAWGLWACYNTRGSNVYATFGIKDVGDITSEDNFDDGNYSGWTVVTNENNNITWSAASQALRATVTGAGGYSYIVRDGVNVSDVNVTVEYDVRFMNGATNGGLVYRDTVLYVNPQVCGWADDNPTYTNYAGLTAGAWHHIVLHVRDGDPYLHSDLYVDANPIYLGQPIEKTNFTSSSVGFLSPYHQGYVEWDNVRIADEHYSLVYEPVNGEFLATNDEATFYPYLPDYDPDMWEHNGTAMGSEYEWYAYFRGGGVHAYSNATAYFAPRLMIEDPAFPSNMDAGATVQVPIEWENLDQIPVNMLVGLEDPYVGTSYVSQVFLLTNYWGTNGFTINIPTNLPPHSNYLWVAYTYPTNLSGTNAYWGRIGLDDTFRFAPDGSPFGPEATISINFIVDSNYVLYSDLGLPPGMAYYTWGGTHNGDYTGITVPEGVKCWQAVASTYAGWGAFFTPTPGVLTNFPYLKLWLKTREPVKIEVEAPQGVTRTLYLPATSYDPARGDEWQELTIPWTNFGSAEWRTNVYGGFMATLDSPHLYATYFVDANTGWSVGSSTYQMGNIHKTTNGGLTWLMQDPGASFRNGTFYGLDFLDANTGWVVGGTNILATTDGGSTWTLKNGGVPGYSYWYDVYFLNSQTGIVCGGPGRILRTVNAGNTWSNLWTPTNSYYYAVDFPDEQNGWACGQNTMAHSSDSGATWANQPLFVGWTCTWYDVKFLNASTGWVCGYPGKLAKTTDGGANWQMITNLPSGYESRYLFSMSWPDANNGRIAVSGGYVYKTTNGGLSWVSQVVADQTLRGIHFSDAEKGVVVGYYNRVYTTTNSAAASPTWTDVGASQRVFYIDHVRWSQSP